MEKYPFLTNKEHKILQSQLDFKPTKYRPQIQKRVSKYLKNIKKCKHEGHYIYHHYCPFHMKDVVMCDTCHAEILPPPIFTKTNTYTIKTHLQKQKVAHDWFL